MEDRSTLVEGIESRVGGGGDHLGWRVGGTVEAGAPRLVARSPSKPRRESSAFTGCHRDARRIRPSAESYKSSNCQIRVTLHRLALLSILLHSTSCGLADFLRYPADSFSIGTDCPPTNLLKLLVIICLG